MVNAMANGWLALTANNPDVELLQGLLSFVDQHLGSTNTFGDVTVLTTASAFTNPKKTYLRLKDQLGALATSVREVPVFNHHDANAQPCIYEGQTDTLIITDGSAIQLLSVLKASRLLGLIEDDHQRGVNIIACGEAAGALCDPLVDPRGGGLSIGLGWIKDLSFSSKNEISQPTIERAMRMASPEVSFVHASTNTGLLRDGSGDIRLLGAPTIYRDSKAIDRL